MSTGRSDGGGGFGEAPFPQIDRTPVRIARSAGIGQASLRTLEAVPPVPRAAWRDAKGTARTGAGGRLTRSGRRSEGNPERDRRCVVDRADGHGRGSKRMRDRGATRTRLGERL